jgi:hypothetical protein
VGTVRDLPKSWKMADVMAVFLCLAVAGGWVFIALGGYNVAADAPHTRPVRWFINEVRSHSIAARSKSIQLPADLEQPARISAGAGLYNEMCTSCHLGPGLKRTEISQGLYPAAPELTHGTSLSPQEEFWIIKHGIKMTGMAAWGKTHNDVPISRPRNTPRW